jgi:hypothetical protein
VATRSSHCCKVSFVEMFQQANHSLVIAGHGKGAAYFYSTMSFFAGILLMLVRMDR